MFAEMRQAVNIPKGSDVLDHIHALPEREQQEAFGKIQDIERKAMSKQVPQAGLVSLMEFLDEHDIPKGICTRNFEYVYSISNFVHVTVVTDTCAVRQSITYYPTIFHGISTRSVPSSRGTSGHRSPLQLASCTLRMRGESPILPMYPHHRLKGDSCQ